MKRALTPAVTTLEDRLALSTTSPSIVVQPPQITGSITTEPIMPVGPLEWFTPISPTPILGLPQPVIIPLPTGTDAICHFVALTTNEFTQTTTTPTVAYFPPQMSFYSVSQLT